MRRLAHLPLAALALSITGCVIRQPVGSSVAVTPETTRECHSHCATLGLRLASVVLVHNSAGCVCEVTDRTTASSGAGAVAATIAIVDDEETARRRQQDHHHTGPGPSEAGHH